ncbi:hypothetical protein HXX76_000469 [Chlamydomonas incerta]|uniref:Suppressor of forked domain-containing protein n=1 Tax=Chlamydomonas incerta TaxID=51695 RepID=A0A836B2K7_CHLIN|nr:hypothetical protein HXX76_000469 [Chlamydomonas incerta]|eukprot:KAG2445865.1 hypothetical protein HXX76_000469 [Chlamydomonas incerta]
MDRDRRGGRGERITAAQLLGKVRNLKVRNAEDKYDVAGWDQAWEELRAMPMTEECRAVYEEVVSAFPTKADVWCKYAELELGAGNMAGLKAIFQRCLMQVPSLELWALYIKFIRRSNKSKGPEGAVEVRNALNFTLEVTGQDVNSGPFWQDCISHLQAAKPGSPEFAALFPQAMAGQEDQARIAAVRKVYQAAVCVPHSHLDGLWRDYQRFENEGPNKQFAKKVLDEWSPKYQAAKAVYRERRKRTQHLSLALWPLPPGKGGLLQDTQAALWRDYLTYERSNPQGLDVPTLQQRVSLAFDQALICFLHFPEFWLDYADWHASCGRADAAAATLSKAQVALPQCLQLRLLAADLHERTGNPQQAVAIFEGLAQNLEQQQAVTRGTLAPAEAGPLLPMTPEQGELVWSQYMLLLRRVENEYHSRKLFLRARKWQQGLAAGDYSCWRLYADAAMLEWRRGRDAGAARNIFEKGLEDQRLFREPQFVLAYLDMLTGLGDLDNARALLARVLADEVNARSVMLWQRYLAFEGMAGDLAAVLEVERQAVAALRGEEVEQLRAALPLVRRDYNLLRAPQELRRILSLPAGPSDASAPAATGRGSVAGGPGANIRPPSEYTSTGPSGAPSEPQLRDVAPQVYLFNKSLPPPEMVEGIVPDVDQVLDVLMALDLAPAAVMQACLDLESGKTLAQGEPAGQEPYGRSEPGGPPYGYGYGSPGRDGYPPPPYGDGPGPGPMDEYAKRRYANDDDDDGYDDGYGGGRDLYHQRLRRRMDG